MIHYYPALIHKEADSDYGVSFPDFPGCVTAGKTYEEAIALAAEALAFHVEGMEADGQRIPVPSWITKIVEAKNEWYDVTGATIAMVPLLPTVAAKPQATNLSLDPALVDAVDRYAEAANMTRSNVFAEGAKLLLQSKLPVRRGKAKARPDMSTEEEIKYLQNAIEKIQQLGVPVRNSRPKKKVG